MRDVAQWMKSVEDRFANLDRRIKTIGSRFPDTDWLVVGSGVGGAPNFRATSGWVNYGGGFTVARFRRLNGMVITQGLVASGSGTIFTYPAGFLPLGGTLIFDAHAGGAEGRVDVDLAGNLTLVGGANSYVSLGNVIFPAEA